MKKKCIMALIIGAAFLAQGCGYEEGTDAVVTVVDSTPTPEPSPDDTGAPGSEDDDILRLTIAPPMTIMM